MATLQLELLDATVGQAVMELQSALSQHAAADLEILLGPDETIRHNLQRLLERNGRSVEVRRQGPLWCMSAAAPFSRPLPAPPLPAALPPPPLPTAPIRRPLLLLRSAFTPGDPALGRRLLLGVIQALGADAPWLGLAHQGIELLEDPAAVRVLLACQGRGIPVRLSSESLLFLGGDPGPFEVMEDQEWQRLMGKGELIVV